MFVLLVTLFVLGANAQTPNLCRNENGTPVPDGNYGVGCRSYTLCTNGMGSVIDCAVDERYNHRKQPTAGCDNIANVDPPCSVERDCSGSTEDAVSYPILDFAGTPGYVPCTYFYTCQSGRDLGTQTCTGGTVFSWHDQTCVFPHSACPPCGTGNPITCDQ